MRLPLIYRPTETRVGTFRTWDYFWYRDQLLHRQNRVVNAVYMVFYDYSPLHPPLPYVIYP